MKNRNNIFLPPCPVWISFSHRFFGLLLWVSIGQATLLTISQYSDSVSWLPQNIRKMALAPKV